MPIDKRVMPKGAKCPENYDCVLLGCKEGYRPQLVRLGAEEKGLKYKNFEMTLGKTNYDPWYVQLNPQAYLPTMVVKPDNQPITESAEIIKYMDDNFHGKKQLLHKYKSQQLQRFDEFMQIHEAWDVEGVTFSGLSKNYIIRSLAPLQFASMMDAIKTNLKENPGLKSVYGQKLASMSKLTQDCMDVQK